MADLLKQSGRGESLNFVATFGGILKTMSALSQEHATIKDEDPSLPGRKCCLPDDSLVVVFWSGNDHKEKKGAIVNQRECDERLRPASKITRVMRDLPRIIFVTGHNDDLYAIPANFDIHVADIRVTRRPHH